MESLSLEIQSEQAWDKTVIIAFDYIRNIAKCSIVYEKRFTTMTANYSDGRFLAVAESILLKIYLPNIFTLLTRRGPLVESRPLFYF